LTAFAGPFSEIHGMKGPVTGFSKPLAGRPASEYPARKKRNGKTLPGQASVESNWPADESERE